MKKIISILMSLLIFQSQAFSQPLGFSLFINVGNKTTLTGAVIGDLTLTTQDLEYSDINDINVSKSNGFGLSTSIGISGGKLTTSGSTTLSVKNTGNKSEQINRATIGNGTIIVDEQEQTEQDLSNLNRDITNTQTITKDLTTGALDASVTMDNRLFTEEGRSSIASDFTNVGGNLAKAAAGLTNTLISPITATYASLTAEGDGNKDVISAWKANQSANATAIGRAGRTDVNEIVKNIKEGTATPEELQYLADITSSGKGNLVYSKEGELIDKKTGEVVLGFNDLEKKQGYINAATGAGTNALTFLQTDAEERAHKYTSNESIAKGAASSELRYYNALSGLLGGETVNSYNSGGWGNVQQVWNETYNTNTNNLLWNNTNEALKATKKAHSLGSNAVALKRIITGEGLYGSSDELKSPNDVNLSKTETTIALQGLTPIESIEKGIVTASVLASGGSIEEANEAFAKGLVKESYEEITSWSDPKEKLANALYGKELGEEGRNDIYQGNTIEGNAKLLLASGITIGNVLGVAGLMSSGISTAGETVVKGVNNLTDDAFKYATTYEKGYLMDIVNQGTPLSKFGETVSMYPEASLYQHNVLKPGVLGDETIFRNLPIKNFYGGYYNEKSALQDILIYRAGNASEPKGQWFTLTPPKSIANVRIDSAVREQWVNQKTGLISDYSYLDTLYTYRMKTGVKYYEGPPSTQGGVYLGGLENNQLFIPRSEQIGGKIILINSEPLTK